MASKEYFEDKSKLYYENYINHKCTKKVRGIVLNEMGQILLLHSKRHNGFSIPGGTVEENESIKDTVIREVFEETGAEIIPIKIVGNIITHLRTLIMKVLLLILTGLNIFTFVNLRGLKIIIWGFKGNLTTAILLLCFWTMRMQ